MLFTYSAGIFSFLKKTAGTFITKDSCHSHSHERAGIRTPDNLIKSQVLYHLSYTPILVLSLDKKIAGAGFEPTTFGL